LGFALFKLIEVMTWWESVQSQFQGYENQWERCLL